MQRMQWLWLFLLVAVSGCFWFSLNPVEQTLAPWALRKSLLYYSGVLALAMMSVGMLLALRWPALENLTGGLDRSYRLHKWLGISGMVCALLHWFIKVEPKALVRQGWVSPDTFQTPAGVTDFFNDPNPLLALKQISQDTGEWAIYGLIALVLIALVKKIPYRRFFLTHRLMPLLYLALVFHGTILFGKLGWHTPIGYLMGLLMATGGIAAVLSLAGRVGKHQHHEGVVLQSTAIPNEAITQIDIKMDPRWHGHTPGQFAFVTFDPTEGAHPFSIASVPNPNRVVRFFIKHLGDYTDGLEQSVHVGQHVTVEGPYGKFSFETGDAAQVWIAAGVGLTPFMGRLEQLAQTASQTKPPIDFYICVRHADGDLTRYALALAQQSGIRAHLVCSAQGEQLTAARLIQAHADLQHTHFWFCGPAGMGDSLRTALTQAGLRHEHFHQELFEMR